MRQWRVRWTDTRPGRRPHRHIGSEERVRRLAYRARRKGATDIRFESRNDGPWEPDILEGAA